MKKIFLLIATAVLTVCNAQAQDKVESFGVFDHLSVGVSAGTTGIGIDLAAPVTDYLQLRAGYSFMPSISYKDDFDYKHNGKMNQTEVEAKLHMGDFKVLADVYPYRSSSFHVSAGFFIGKPEVVTLENTTPVTDFEPGEGFFIDDYLVGFDSDGYARGAIRVNSFKPYLGIGFGRAVPKDRISMRFDMGVQFWGSPGVYEKQTGEYLKVEKKDTGDHDNGVINTVSKITVYPVISFRLAGRIF